MATHKFSGASGSQGFSVSIHPKELGTELGWGRDLAAAFVGTVSTDRASSVGWDLPFWRTGLPVKVGPLEGLQAIASWAPEQYLIYNLESPVPIQTRREPLVSSCAGYELTVEKAAP